MTRATEGEGETLVGAELPHRVVRASAGSGKTHRLALRYLEILFAGGQPESIVAATFTREAAGEILGRVLTRLAGAAGDGAEAARLGRELGRPELERRQAERALRAMCDALDRVVVSTLDSFFFRLTAALRFELGLSSVPAVAAIDDPLLVAMREDALEDTLAALAERDARDLIDLFERLQGAGARRSVARSLDALLLALYEIYQEAPDAERWGSLDLAAGPHPADLARAIETLNANLRASAPGALRRALAADLEHARRGEWERVLERGLTGKIAGEPAAARFGAVAIPVAWRDALGVVVAGARREVLAAHADRTRATHRLLRAFHRHYWERRRRRGVLLFSDLATGLARWLPSQAGETLDELYFRIDARVGHLLLDEFQDTSLAQWSVLRPIAEEIRAWGDGSRTFFCVGDPKQAIYGWRGGCADLFDQIEEDLGLAPGSGERLEESFRSSQVVLDMVNQVFERLGVVAALDEHAETVARWSAAFGAHRAKRTLAGYAELVESPAGEDHVEWAAGRIGELAASMPRASIAVLVQTNEQAVATLDALRRRGVEASGEGVGAVADDPATVAVIAALVLADHPSDTIAAFQVASSPLGPRVGPRFTWPLDPGDTLAASRRLRWAFVTHGAAGLLASWRRALRGAADRRSRQRLAQAVDLAERFEREGGGRPGDLAAFLARASVESPRFAGVRVMTVHRAKGLEFDVVVLPALERQLLRGPDAPVYLLRRSPLAPVDAVHRSAPASVRRLAPELLEGHAQERARRLRDDLSVLYVALTRARHALHLWVEPKATPRNGGGGREVLSFAGILRATLAGSSGGGPGSAGDLGPAADDGTSRLYSAGDRAAVYAALAGPRAPARAARQGTLPLAGKVEAASADRAALRPAVGLDELVGTGEVAAAELLAGAWGASSPRPEVWAQLDAWMAGPAEWTLPAAVAEGGGAPPRAVLEGRAWLLDGGRRIERRESHRRFACSLHGTIVAGELPRLWMAAAPGVVPRALVAASYGVLPDEGTSANEEDGASLGGAAARSQERRAEILRAVVSRVIVGEPGRGSDAIGPIAVLLYGSSWSLLALPAAG